LVYLVYENSNNYISHLANPNNIQRGLSVAMKKFNWIDAIIVLSFLLLVYLILVRIFGNSSSDLQIMIGLLTFLGSLTIKSIMLSFNLNREFGETRVNIMNSFNNIKDDMTSIKENINSIKKKLKIK